MKLILEEEQIIDGEKTIKKIKEISKEDEAVKGQFIHKCYHDEGKGRPCKRYKK